MMSVLLARDLGRRSGERVHASGVVASDELHDPAGVRLGTVVVVDPSADYLGDCVAPQSRSEVVKFGWAATAAQLAASITFLLSDDGTNVNGATVARLPASGGRRSDGSSPPSGRRDRLSGKVAQPGVGQARGDRAADDGSADGQDSGRGGPRGPGRGLTAENPMVPAG